ncbi:Hypothetical predicted protein [Podarcis lilfordi]|uniref:Uncharacterized protein n=1 Tax=Podarcis lilfordi TaxID=74358 RepID=A0AA35PDX1_9SAUR|nr:Hypothetical predicted protein [Podarcis lilfordi]
MRTFRGGGGGEAIGANRFRTGSPKQSPSFVGKAAQPEARGAFAEFPFIPAPHNGSAQRPERSGAPNGHSVSEPSQPVPGLARLPVEQQQQQQSPRAPPPPPSLLSWLAMCRAGLEEAPGCPDVYPN